MWDLQLSVEQAAHHWAVKDTEIQTCVAGKEYCSDVTATLGKCRRPIKYYMADSQFKSSVEN